MKKTLLATTSIVAVGLASAGAQAQWDVNVGGSMSQWFVGVGQDVPGHNSTHVNGNTEIQFDARNVLDNGLTFGVKVELEGDSFARGAFVDESVLFIQSPDYGRFEIGMEDSAGKQMLITGPSVGFAANSGTWTDFVIPYLTAGFIGNSPAYTTLQSAGGDSDDPKITYYTPRVSGFQFGISYTPDTAAGGTNANFIGAGGGGISYLHGVDGGINYVGSFGPVDVSASGGLFWASGPSGQVGALVDRTTNNNWSAATSLSDDFFSWNVGASVGYAGFTLGGSYVSVESGQRAIVTAGPGAGTTGNFGVAAPVVATNEGDGWEVGLSYEQGPWAFGVSYFTGVQEGVILNPDRDFTQSVTGGVSYTLAPGVNVLASIGFVESDSEFVSGGTFGGVPAGTTGTTTTTGFPATDDNSGVYGGVGFALSF